MSSNRFFLFCSIYHSGKRLRLLIPTLKKEFKFQDEEMNSNQKVVLRESGIQISNKGNFLFFYFRFTFRLFNKVGKKFCLWLDSNRGPLVSKATALPTVPLPIKVCLNY